MLGPNLPFSPWPTATVQLHQTGHSSIAQHFRKMKVGSADFAELGFAYVGWCAPPNPDVGAANRYWLLPGYLNIKANQP